MLEHYYNLGNPKNLVDEHHESAKYIFIKSSLQQKNKNNQHTGGTWASKEITSNGNQRKAGNKNCF